MSPDNEDSNINETNDTIVDNTLQQDDTPLSDEDNKRLKELKEELGLNKSIAEIDPTDPGVLTELKNRIEKLQNTINIDSLKEKAATIQKKDIKLKTNDLLNFVEKIQNGAVALDKKAQNAFIKKLLNVFELMKDSTSHVMKQTAKVVKSILKASILLVGIVVANMVESTIKTMEVPPHLTVLKEPIHQVISVAKINLTKEFQDLFDIKSPQNSQTPPIKTSDPVSSDIIKNINTHTNSIIQGTSISSENTDTAVATITSFNSPVTNTTKTTIGSIAKQLVLTIPKIASYAFTPQLLLPFIVATGVATVAKLASDLSLPKAGHHR